MTKKEEQIEQLEGESISLALALMGVPVNINVVRAILATQKVVRKKGMKLNLQDVQDLKKEINSSTGA